MGLAVLFFSSIGYGNEEPWMVLNYQIEYETEVSGALYVGSFKARTTTIYCKTGVLLIIEEGRNTLFIEVDSRTSTHRFWKKGQDRLLPQYSSVGLPPWGWMMIPYLSQYEFLMRGTRLQSLPDGTTQYYIDSLGSSTLENSKVTEDGQRLYNLTIEHPNERISRILSMRTVIPLRGERVDRPLQTLRFDGKVEKDARIASNVEGVQFKRNGGIDSTIRSRVTRVTTLPPGTTLEDVTASATSGAMAIPVDTPNLDLPIRLTLKQEASSTAQSLHLALIATLAGIVLGSIGILLMWLQHIIRRRDRRRGITLIELTVVLGVLLVLAGLLTVNLLHAQIRAKVTRAHGDMRVLRDAVEAYRLDHTTNPRMTFGDPPFDDRYEGQGSVLQPLFTTLGYWLTTPVAYVSTFDRIAPFDPGPSAPIWFRLYGYVEKEGSKRIARPEDHYTRTDFGEGGTYFITALGPAGLNRDWERPQAYDPTNGVLSLGELYIGPRSSTLPK